MNIIVTKDTMMNIPRPEGGNVSAVRVVLFLYIVSIVVSSKLIMYSAILL